MALDAGDLDLFRRSVLVHELAAGQGCAELLRSDAGTSAMLLERLGPNLHDLAVPVPAVLEAVVTTLRSFWRPVADDCDLPTGADQAEWLAGHISTTWEDLGRPCAQEVIDRALLYCEERASAFDPTDTVLVHGDAHGWNTLVGRRRGVQVRRPRGAPVGAGARSERADARVQRTAAGGRHGAGWCASVPSCWRRGPRSIPNPSGSGASSSGCRQASPTSATSTAMQERPSSTVAARCLLTPGSPAWPVSPFSPVRRGRRCCRRCP